MKKKQVRVLVVAGLANNTLDCYVSQIAKSEMVEVCVLRSRPGVARERVTYICPPSMLRKSPLLSFLWKALYSLRLGASKRISCIYAIFAYPHLYLAYLIAYLTKKPLFYSIIAARYELVSRNPVLQTLTIKLARKASKIIMSGEGVEKLLTEKGIQSKDLVKYSILELVNLEGFEPLKQDRPIDLIVVSRLVPDKHIDVFIDIVASLKESNPSIKAAVIGNGGLKKDLEDYVNSLNLSDNIKFHGYVSSANNINRILNSAKIFVLNSSHEGGPFTVPEAMAAGLCVISSNVGEVKNVIEHGQNGFVVERYNDVDNYVNIIRMLLENPETLEKIQRRAAKIKNRGMNTSLGRFWERAVAKLHRS